MPTLNWIGKEAVVDHHLRVPTRLLECDRELSVGDPDAENLLVEGDNLEALKALLPRYRGQVKCIYIDPPYNTGNENWVYNDNVNDPRIRKWLGEVVGKEAEDLCRHDKWLCMMYPRLSLLKEILRPDGTIFVSIDDVEVAHLRLILDEIFGPRNLIGNFVWQSKDTPGNNSSGVAETHNHILAYRRSEKSTLNLLGRNERQLATYSNPDGDRRGPWLAAPLTRVEHRDRDYYALTNKAGREVFPPKGSSWRRPPKTIQRLIAEDRIWWGKDGNSTFPMEKKFLSEAKEGVVNQTWWPYQFAGSTRQASAELKSLFSGGKPFDTPKPLQLLRVILSMATDSSSLVLDSFAGSGTTGHAVMELNVQDGGNRRVVLVEMDESVCREVTAQRLAAAIKGLHGSDAIATNGGNAGLGFRHCRLGRTLLDENGNINGDVPFTDLARYVFLLETGVPVPKRPRNDCPLLGVHRGRAIYLLYNGVLGDRRPNGGNVLTNRVLAELPPHPDGRGPRVMYGEACRLGEATLAREDVTFHQIPYSLRET